MSKPPATANPFQKLLAKQPELKELFTWTINQFVAQKIGAKTQSEKEQRESIKKAIVQSLNKPT